MGTQQPLCQKLLAQEDSFEDAFTYLDHTVPEEMVDREMLKTYLHNAPKMVDFLHDNTRLTYRTLSKYPDYYSNLPGSRNGHRSMEPEPINITALGKDIDKIIPDGVLRINYKYSITQEEGQILVEKQADAKKVLTKDFSATLSGYSLATARHRPFASHDWRYRRYYSPVSFAS